MSRIFEALQRADSERRETPETATGPAGDPISVPGIEESLLATAGISIEGIAEHSWNPSMHHFPVLEENGEVVEQFRGLRTRIQQLSYQEPLKTILVSSGLPEEGKSFVTANLALTLARNNQQSVLLIDGDLRRPGLNRMLGAPNAPGLSEYLSGTAELPAILQRDRRNRNLDTAGLRGLANITFIPAGLCGENSPEIIANRSIEELIANLAPHFDWILIDSSPVLVVTDAVDMARAADAVLLVARDAKTPGDAAQRTHAAFGDKRILGYVLNAAKNPPRSSYSSYYYGGQEVMGGARRQANSGRRG